MTFCSSKNRKIGTVCAMNFEFNKTLKENSGFEIEGKQIKNCC